MEHKKVYSMSKVVQQLGFVNLQLNREEKMHRNRDQKLLRVKLKE
jgi:hypothetical protein